MEIKRVPAFEIEGKRFNTKKEAELHRAHCQLDKLLEADKVGNQDWTREEIREWLLGAGWPLINILSDINRRRTEQAKAGEE